MVEPRVSHAVLLLLLSIPGCLGGDTGTEVSRGILCSERGSETPLGSDELTVYGKPRLLALPGQGEQHSELHFSTLDGGDQFTTHSTQVAVELTIDFESARLVERKDRHYPNAMCQPEIELSAVLRLESSDGTFAEQAPGTLRLKVVPYDGVTQGMFFATLALEQQRGSYPVGAFPDVEAFQIVMQMSGWREYRTAPDWSGEISLPWAHPSPGKIYSARTVAWW